MYDASRNDENQWFPRKFSTDTDLIEWKKERQFHVHQCYEKPKDTETAYCTVCGGNHFYVGSGDCFTAIKCVNCNFEVMIHDG